MFAVTKTCYYISLIVKSAFCCVVAAISRVCCAVYTVKFSVLAAYAMFCNGFEGGDVELGLEAES